MNNLKIMTPNSSIDAKGYLSEKKIGKKKETKKEKDAAQIEIYHRLNMDSALEGGKRNVTE